MAFLLEEKLFDKGYQVYVLDGDNVRYGLNSDLGFSSEDRTENIRRVGEAAALFADAGMVCIAAFISPYREDRDIARRAAGSRFCEIYIEANVETCEDRDPKGLYEKAKSGEIRNFTGISAPYEAPLQPDLVVNTQQLSIEESLDLLLDFVEHQCELGD